MTIVLLKRGLYIYDILCYEYLTLFVIFWSKININQTYIFPMKSNRKKCNLNQLAGIMPIIGNEEQKNSVGGDYYYSEQGELLGYQPGGNQIRVIDKAQYSNGMYSTAKLLCYASSEAQRNVFSKIAGVDCQVTAGASVPDSNGYVEESYCTPSGQIYMNYYGSVYRQCDFWDVYSTLLHERTHLGQIGSNLTSDDRELLARQAQINDPYFSRCSEDYQLRVLCDFVLRGGTVYF